YSSAAEVVVPDRSWGSKTVSSEHQPIAVIDPAALIEGTDAIAADRLPTGNRTSRTISKIVAADATNVDANIEIAHIVGPAILGESAGAGITDVFRIRHVERGVAH